MKKSLATRLCRTANMRHVADAKSLGALALVGMACLAGGVAAQTDDDPVGTVRSAYREWVETERLISKERSEWGFDRELLRDRIELMRNEVERTQAATAAARESTSQLDGELEELEAEQAELGEATAALSEAVSNFEQRLRDLAPRLPDALRHHEAVELLARRLPLDPAATEARLSARYLTIAGLLQEFDRFDREVRTGTTVVTLDDGASVEVTTLFVGLGQAYYVAPNGSVAGIGTYSEVAGWVWKRADAAAAQIHAAIAVAEGASSPAFVRLPVAVD